MPGVTCHRGGIYSRDGDTEVRLAEDARQELRPGEALVFDWHRLAICCAAAGKVSLRRTTLTEVERSGALVPLADEADFGLCSVLGRPLADPVSGGAK